jgi:hypothetical protein
MEDQCRLQFSAPPMTFEVNGKQYVAIVSGPSTAAKTNSSTRAQGAAQRDLCMSSARDWCFRFGCFHICWVWRGLPATFFRHYRTGWGDGRLLRQFVSAAAVASSSPTAPSW